MTRVITIALCLGILALLLLYMLPEINQCHADGGTVVRGLIGLECVK